MEQSKFTISGGAGLAVPVSDADKLLSLGNGSAALLYLYALRSGGSFSLSEAAIVLQRTENEIQTAAELLGSAGLFCQAGHHVPSPLPADELPEYSASDILARTSENGEFKAIVEETQRIMGRTLTGADLKLLFGMYDHLRLPTEVIFMLIHHCVEDTHQRLGPSALPSMRTIEKEAYVWYNREILTLERAEEFLQQKRRRGTALSEIKRVLQINGRNLSTTERKYVESWLDMGFSIDAIALAYDKTVVKTGSLAWRYMNSILANWHEKGLHTADDAEAGDSRSYARVAARPSSQGSASGFRDDAELMRKILNNTKPTD